MASNDMKISVGADISGLQQGMEQGKQSIHTFESEVEAINETISETISETKSLRQEYRQAMGTVQKMAAAYANLSKEEKNSTVGKEMFRQLNEAKEAAAQLLDATSDLSAEIKTLASDSRGLDILQDTFDIAGNAATSVLSGIAMITGKQEDFNRALSAFAAVQSTVNTLIKINNALQKQSSVMLGIRNLQTKALAKAQKLETESTIGATIAQKAFNIVAKANPYVLLATAIVTVVGALATFVALTNKSKKEEEEQKEIAEKNKTAFDAYSSSIIDTSVSYDKLQAEWRSLKTEAEKTQWIKDNKDEFHKLGVEITDITDAENFLVTNTEAVKKAFDERAKAAAAAALATENYKKALDKMGKVKENDGWVTADEAIDMGISYEEISKNREQKTAIFGKNKYKLTEEQQERANKNLLNNVEEENKELYDGIVKSEKNTKKSLEDAQIKIWDDKNDNKTKGATSKAKKQIKTEMQKLQDEVNLYKKQLENVDIYAPSADFEVETIQKKIKEAENKLKQYKVAVGIEIEPEVGSVNYFRDKIAELQKQQVNLKVGSEEWTKLQNEIDNYTNEQHEIEIQIKANEIKANLEKEINEILNPKQDLEYNFDFLDNGMKEAANKLLSQTNGIQNEMDKLQNKIDLSKSKTEVEILTEQFNKLENQLKSNIITLNEFQTKSNELETADKKLKEQLKTYDNMEQAAQALGSTLSSLGQITDNQAFNTAAVVAETLAQLSLSFAKAMTQTKHPWEWAAFGLTGLAQLMSMISAIKSAQGYANGGVIGGHSYTGDKLMARVNSREVILNEKQQKNALNAMDNIDNTITQNINVDGKWELYGDKLYLCLKNYSKGQSKLGKNTGIR